MAKELQMWADENKTIKGYPKTKAESVYTNEGKKVENELKVIKTNLDNITTDLNGYSFVDTTSENEKELYLEELENPLPPVIATGDENKILAVKSDRTGVEWVEKPTGGGSGSSIDDINISTGTTYSSTKIESRLDEIVLESGNVVFRKLNPGEIIEWDFDIPVVNVESVSLNKSTTSINVGLTEQLTATVLPSNTTNKTVTWSSSNNSVATVSSTGLVTGVANGSATITCTSVVDASKTDSCSITVSSEIPSINDEIYIEGGYLNAPLYIMRPYSNYTQATNAEHVTKRISSKHPLFDFTADDFVSDSQLQYIQFGNLLSHVGECITNSTSDAYGLYIKLTSANAGADLTTFVNYLKNNNITAKMKLNTGYKIFNVGSDVANVTTRTTGVTAGYEYVSFTLVNGVGDYKGTTVKHFCSNACECMEQVSYTYSYAEKAIKVKPDNTCELLLPLGTLTSKDVAGVQAYLKEAQLKIYYI